MKALITLLISISMGFLSIAQPFGGFDIFAVNENDEIVVKITPKLAAVPANSVMTDLVFSISWPVSYGVDLDINMPTPFIPVLSGVVSKGPQYTYGTTALRSFGISSQITIGPWALNVPVTIMKIQTTLNAPGGGVGTFNIYPYDAVAYNGGSGVPMSQTAMPLIIDDVDPSPYIGVSGIFDDFMDPTTAAIAVPLPIELLSFNAVASKEAIDLRWATAKEENFRGFDLERSLDGKKFDKITFVAGKAAKGATYDFSDRNVSKGTRYFYRLKIVNTDATFEYSDIRTAMIQGAATTGVTIYPNPSNGDVKLDFTLEEDTNTTIDLFDIAGKNVFRKEVEAKKDRNVVTLEIMDLPSGVYTVRMNMGGKIVTKLVKLSKN